MSYRRQRSHGSRVMASTARDRAKESGKPCYLIYDTSWRSYYACSAPENGWSDNEKFVKRFLPDGTSDDIDDVPQCAAPIVSKYAEELSEQLCRELDELGI